MEIYNHVLYVIEPRAEFTAWLSGRVSPETADFLLEPVTYHSQEKDDSSWLESDRLLKAKLVFLANLDHDHRSPFTTEGEFTALFGTASITEALFDRWWTIQRHQATREIGWPERSLAHSTEPASPTGSPRVDEWMARLRDWRGKPSNIGSVLFHSPSDLQISPLIHGVWPRPLLELLEESGAAGGFGNDPDGSCAQFIAWCLSKDRPPTMGVQNIRGAPWNDADPDPYEWYEKTMAIAARLERPPLLVNLDEFTITTHLHEILWPPSKRGMSRPKDPRAVRLGSPFPWAWYGVGLGEYPSRTGTYNGYPYESLPPVPVPLDGTFRWLQSVRSDLRVMGHVEAIEANLARVLAEQKTAGLPREFIEFFQSPALWRKMRSCTDCYFNLDPASTAIPGGLGRLVRFISDSQGCIHWHIHIAPCGTKHTVVATYHFTGSEHSDRPGGKPHPRDITTCAASFEEFMYRFWMENELWWAINHQEAMPEHGEEYLAHYKEGQIARTGKADEEISGG